MSEFLRVLGDDPGNRGEKIHLFIRHTIVAMIYPVWGVFKDGVAHLCTPNHPGAKVVSCMVVDHDGNRYSCARVDELGKLLSKEEIAQLFGKTPEHRQLGFQGQKGKENLDPADFPSDA